MTYEYPITPPATLPPAPPTPQRNKGEDEFEQAADAAFVWIYTDMPHALESMAQSTYDNALAGEERVIAADASAQAAAQSASGVQALADKAQAWAESDTPPAPGSKSAKSHAADAAADAQQTAADRAAIEQAVIDGPVTSVNGQHGTVVLTAADVGAVAEGTETFSIAQAQAVALSF